MTPSPPLLEYERPRAGRPGAFAGLYVTLGAIGLLIGLGRLALHSLLLLTATIVARGDSPALDLVIYCAASSLLDLTLIAASVDSLRRMAWSRKAIEIFAKLDLVVVGIALLAALSTRIYAAMLSLTPGPSLKFVIFLALVLVRVLHDLIWWQAYGNIRGDFYFSSSSSSATTTGAYPIPNSTPASEPEPLSSPAVAQPQPAFRYRVRGFDRASARPVEFLSKAATEELARRSALALGLDPQNLMIEPIEPAPRAPFMPT